MISPEQLEEIVNKAAKAAFKAELGTLYIDRQQHYQDHQFIKKYREWSEMVSSTFWKTIIRGIGWALMGLLLLGFTLWGQHHFK